MNEVFPIRRKTLHNKSINQSIIQSINLSINQGLLRSQLVPVKPLVQAQVYVFPEILHVPPF